MWTTPSLLFRTWRRSCVVVPDPLKFKNLQGIRNLEADSWMRLITRPTPPTTPIRPPMWPLHPCHDSPEPWTSRGRFHLRATDRSVPTASVRHQRHPNCFVTARAGSQIADPTATNPPPPKRTPAHLPWLHTLLATPPEAREEWSSRNLFWRPCSIRSYQRNFLPSPHCRVGNQSVFLLGRGVPLRLLCPNTT